VVPGESAIGHLRRKVADLERRNRALRFAAEQADLVREQFSDLYDYAPVGYVTVDARGAIRRLNLTAAALLGGSRKELEGVSLGSIVLEAEQAACDAFLEAVLSSSGSMTFEARLRPGKWRAEFVKFIATRASTGRDLALPGPLVRVVLLDVTFPDVAKDQR